MATRDEISKWLVQTVVEVENRNSDDANPQAEDVRQLASSLRYVLGYAQEMRGVHPHVAETIFKWAAKPFSEHEGYDPTWNPSTSRE